MTDKVGIIGGGISGLAAAYYGLRKGLGIELFEASGQLGGLAASFDFNCRVVEKYYHFICGADQDLIHLADELGLKGEIQFRPARTAYYYNGRLFPFSSPLDLLRFSPISFLSRLRSGILALSSTLRKDWDALDDISAQEWLVGKVGRQAFDVIWSPLLKIKFRDQHDRISAAWIWHRIHRQSSSRRSVLSKEKYGFFTGGTQSLLDRLEERIRRAGGIVHLRTEARRIEPCAEGFRVTLWSGERTSFNKVIMAVPLTIAADLIEGLDPAYAEKLRSVGFLGVACGVFRLKKKVSEAFWLNIHDPRIPVNGFIEYTNLNPAGSETLIYVPLYLRTSDPWYSKEDADLKSELMRMLQIINPGLSESDVIDFRVFRSSFAQAICPTGFKSRVLPVKIPIEGLYLLDSTQLYPSDRVLSALIGLAHRTIDENM